MKRTDNPKALNLAFDIILSAARKKERCPTNDTPGLGSDLVGTLARAGRIRVEVYALNFRRIVITSGPYSGEATAPAPPGWEPYIIIDRHGRKKSGQNFVDDAGGQRAAPSLPRILTRKEIERA